MPWNATRKLLHGVPRQVRAPVKGAVHCTRYCLVESFLAVCGRAHVWGERAARGLTDLPQGAERSREKAGAAAGQGGAELAGPKGQAMQGGVPGKQRKGGGVMSGVCEWMITEQLKSVRVEAKSQFGRGWRGRAAWAGRVMLEEHGARRGTGRWAMSS